MSSEANTEKTAENWYHEGLSMGRLGNNEASIAAYRKTVELDPSNFRAWFNLGIRYGKIMKNLDAAKCFKKALEFRPEDALCHYSLAVVSNLIGETDEAFKHYGETLRINPDFAKAHSNLAMLHYSLKRGKDTVRHLRLAKKLFERQADLQMTENARNLLNECYKEFGIKPEDPA